MHIHSVYVVNLYLHITCMLTNVHMIFSGLLDVKSLHDNIPNNKEIKAVKKAYDKHPNKSNSTKLITNFLSLVLTLNNLILNSGYHIQKRDV